MFTLKIWKKYNRHEHSFLSIFKTESVANDPFVFIVKDMPLGDSSSSSSTSSSLSSSSSSSSSSSQSSSGGFLVFPDRVLVSIASKADMLFYPIGSPGPDLLYRADTVAIILRAKSHMDSVVEEVIGDVRENVALQQKAYASFEVITVEDITSDDTGDLWFR